MTDFDVDNFIRTRYGISDPIAQAWITGITGGIVVAAIVSMVAYYHTAPPPPLTPTVYETLPVLPLMPTPPPEAPKP